MNEDLQQRPPDGSLLADKLAKHPSTPEGKLDAILARVVRTETRIVRLLERLGFDSNGKQIGGKP